MNRHSCARALVAAVLAAGACAPAYDPTRTSADPGTFGHRVVTLMCKRLAYQAEPTDVSGDHYREACRGDVAMPDDAPPTLIALAANRARLEAAIDFAVPEDVYDPLQRYLTSPDVLALYDDDTMSKSIASIADMLTEMSSDPDAMAAFSRMGTREGYRNVAQAIGPAGPLTSSAAIREVMSEVLPTIVDGGRSKAEWDALVLALGMTMADASPKDTGSTAAGIANDFLLTEQPDLGEATPLYMVRRDARGIAKVALVGGAIPAPFADVDGDLLADVDESGRFVGADGTALAAVPTPFPTRGDSAMRDGEGRAIDASGTPVYEYFDVTKTVLGSMLNDQIKLLDPANGTVLDLVRGAAFLLGDRAQTTRTFDNGTTLTYLGYDTQQSPLLDMAYAFAQLLRDPNILDTLALGEVLVDEHESAAARLLEAAIEAARLADTHPEAELLADAPFWDDMRPLLEQIAAKPKLVKDLLAALERPETQDLVLFFRDQMKYKDRFDIASDQSVTGSFATPVDRTQPDSGFNRSLWQRLVHLISDTNRAVQCSKAGAQIKDPLTGLPLATYQNACDFFRVPNMAVFYLQANVYAKDANGKFVCETTAGEFGNTTAGTSPEDCVAQGRRARRKADFHYNWTGVVRTLVSSQGGDRYLEQQSTIAGFGTHPTAEALTRVLFLDPMPQSLKDTSDDATDRFGAVVKVKHAGSLPAWEKVRPGGTRSFLEASRPLMQAFADSDAEQIFVDIVSVMHKHWSTAASTDTQHTNPNGANYTIGANGVSYEPLVMEFFEGDVWPALTENAAELNAITINGKPFSTVLANAAHFFIAPLPGLTDRRGQATTTTADGSPVPVLSPWHLIADAYLAKRARLAGATDDRGALWPDSTRELVDLMFRADHVGDAWQFRSPHMAAATRGLVKLLRDRIVEHDAAGDRLTWLSTDLPQKIEDFAGHPLFAAAADFVESQTKSGAPRLAMEHLLTSVFDPAAAPEAYATMRVGAADLVQLAQNDAELVPLGHLIGKLLAPDRTYLATQLALLHRMHQADTESTLTGLVARLFQTADPASDPGIPSISAIADGVGDVDRVDPGPPAPWSAADYASVFANVGTFFREEQHGMPRFVTIIKERNAP
jgi:hypothetical protein